MRLILSGGGSRKDTKEQDILFASLLNIKKPLIFISIARGKDKTKALKYFNYLKETLKPLGIKRYIKVDEDNYKNFLEKDSFQFSGVYIGGGNTPYLLKKLKDTKLHEFLKKLLKENIPIMGGSAGAIIFSNSIIPSLYYDKNNINLKDFSGMNILKNWEITCHYTRGEEEKTKKIIKENNFDKLVALTDKNGLYVEDKKITLIGQESAWIFSKDRDITELKVGEELK